MQMEWIYLIVAGLLEVCWALGLKFSEGFSRFWPSVFTLVTLAASMILLALATKTIPIGTAYGVWVGIGAVGAALLGIILFSEPVSPRFLFFLGLLTVSIIGLKLSGAH